MEFLKPLLKPEIIWFIIGLLFLLLEFTLPGLIIVFFGIGAWITSLCCLVFDVNINLQIIIFIATSIISLILLRNYLKKRFFKEDQQPKDTLADEFIGKTAEVELDIKDGKQGKISFKGTTWNAESDHNIKKGQLVKIISKESIVLKVEPLDTNKS